MSCKRAVSLHPIVSRNGTQKTSGSAGHSCALSHKLCILKELQLGAGNMHCHLLSSPMILQHHRCGSKPGLSISTQKHTRHIRCSTSIAAHTLQYKQHGTDAAVQASRHRHCSTSITAQTLQYKQD
jgi:hypothetical protein